MIEPEKFAEQKFDKVLATINSLLKKNEKLNIENLRNIYTKLKRKDQRVGGLCALPVVGTITQYSLTHDFSLSDDVLKIAKLMNTLDLNYIDQEILYKLKEQKDDLYSKYFKEEYETEARSLEYQDQALNVLFPSEQEK